MSTAMNTILVADHNRNRLASVSVALTHHGFTVVPARTTDEVIAGLAGSTVSAIVSDLGLPGMAPEALSRQARYAHPQVRIILLDGRDSSESQREATRERTGCDAILSHPFQNDQVVPLLSSWGIEGRQPEPLLDFSFSLTSLGADDRADLEEAEDFFALGQPVQREPGVSVSFDVPSERITQDVPDVSPAPPVLAAVPVPTPAVASADSEADKDTDTDSVAAPLPLPLPIPLPIPLPVPASDPGGGDSLVPASAESPEETETPEAPLPLPVPVPEPPVAPLASASLPIEDAADETAVVAEPLSSQARAEVAVAPVRIGVDLQSRLPPAVPRRGTLASLPLPRLLYELYVGTYTGVLRLEQEDRSCTIYFVAGAPGRVEADPAVVDAADASGPDALVPTEHLLLHLFTWQNAVFAFTDETDFVDDAPLIEIQPLHVIWRGIGASADTGELFSFLAQMRDKYIVGTAQFPMQYETVRAFAAGLPMALLVDGQHTVEEALRLDDRRADRIAQALYVLLVTDMIRPGPEPGAPALLIEGDAEESRLTVADYREVARQHDEAKG